MLTLNQVGVILYPLSAPTSDPPCVCVLLISIARLRGPCRAAGQPQGALPPVRHDGARLRTHLGD